MSSDPGSTALVSSTLHAGWGGRLVLTHVEQLADATHELHERTAGCVILDAEAAGADALESIAELRSAAPDVALLILIGAADDRLGVEAVRSGAQDCLVKAELNPTLLRRSVLHAIQRQRVETRLTHQALHDQLTGLPNRALFLDRLGVALDRSRRTRTSVAVLFLDVDNFKEINDTLGHAAGDRVLEGLSERLRGMLRPMDTVARFGGDEFTLLFEDLTSEREVVLIAERISHAVSAPIAAGGADTVVSVSIGISLVSDPAVVPEAVIREADVAMYRAKERGGSRYELYDESTRQRASERLALEAGLRQAIQRSELKVHYQPKVTLDGAIEVVGFEALVRWEHPQRGLLSPGDFIPLAEETGMVSGIGQFVLEQALAQIARWRRSSPDVTVSVNVSARQLDDPGLASVLAAAVQAAGSDPEALCLEITERALSSDPETAVRTLSALKSVGVRLAIDDYGTGSSLLSTLRRLPIDTLKVHESLVSGVGTDREETTIVGAVVDLGHALGMRVVAEGVETEDQLEQLQALGCDGAQGYLFSPAIPENEAYALLLSD